MQPGEKFWSISAENGGFWRRKLKKKNNISELRAHGIVEGSNHFESRSIKY